MKDFILCYFMLLTLLLTPLALQRRIPFEAFGSNAALCILAFAEGAILWAYGLFLFNFCGGLVSRWGILIIFFAISLAALRHRGLATKNAAGRNDFTLVVPLWTSVICWLLILWAVFTAWMQAVSLPLYHFDAVAHFGFFGKALYTEGTYRIPSLYNNHIFHSAPEYPYLVPYLEALSGWAIGGFNDGLVKHLFLAFWIVFLGTCYLGLRWRASRSAALFGTALLATLPLFSADNQTQAVSGCADIVFTVFWTWLMLSALRFLDSLDRRWLAQMVLFSVGCAFTKPNGAVISIIPWALLYWKIPHQRRHIVGGGMAFGVILVPWLWTSYTLHTGGYKERTHWEIRTLAAAVRQIPGTVTAMAQELGRIPDWGLFWMAVGLSLAVAWRRRRFQRQEQFLLYGLAIQILLYSSAYLIFPETAVWWVNATFSRWLIHFAPLTLMLAAWSWESNPTPFP